MSEDSESGERLEHCGPIVLMSANSAWNIAYFRAGLVRALVEKGYRVAVAAPRDEWADRLADLGADFIDLPIDSSGASPIRDARLLLRYRRLMRELRPFAFLGFTAKPNIYGSLAAGFAGTKVINNITGLGTVFIKRSPLTRVVTELYRAALRRSSTVFFQNPEDLEFFISKGLVRRPQARPIPGDGIDLIGFQPEFSSSSSGPVRFLLIARLLWDKGVGEFVEAARMLRRVQANATFQILGPSGVDNRTAVPAATLAQWREEAVVDYLGAADDVRPAIRECDCVVLPSYREGLPRTLLEGSAMGKPLVATDVPGCRDVVIDGETGFLCEVRSAAGLAEAMQAVVDLSPEERTEMGRKGRAFIEANFSEALVAAKYLEALGRP